VTDRLTWLGHATVLLEVGGLRLVTDPVFGRRVAHLRRRVPAPPVPADVDAVLLSHLHRDHADGRSLRALGSRTRVLAPAGAGGTLRRLGLREICELAVGDAVALSPSVTVRAVAAKHDGRRLPFGREVPALGYVVEGPARIYFAGDTGLFAGMAALADPRLDAALLPIWGWGPSLGPGHLDPATAAHATALLRPRVVVPIHWGTFLPMTSSARHAAVLSDPVDAFLEQLRNVPVAAAALAPGEMLDLPTTRPG
jgi:L-ascorbate metabolism protein UlaG (beta-lactamase superfamily)